MSETEASDCRRNSNNAEIWHESTGTRPQPSLQYHGQHLVIGLNRDGQGLAPLESFFGDFEANDDGSFLLASGGQLRFGRKRRLRTFFQSREPLVIAVEIHGRIRVF